jgi:hypothetical protein
MALAIRFCKTRAICVASAMAVAHTQLVIVYHLLKEATTYREMGAD